MNHRIGIVGIGRIAQTYFSVLRRIKNVQISFICDIFPSQMEKAVAKFPDLLTGTPQVSSSDEAFERGIKADTVLIATPLETHFMLAERSLRRGFRTLLEKPSVSSFAELRRLYELAEQNRTLYQTMFHYAYAPEVEAFLKMRSSVESRLGKVRGFACDFQDPAVSGSRLIISPRKRGGSYLSSGVNALSVLERVFAADSAAGTPGWGGLAGLRTVSHSTHQVPDLIDLNEERVVPEVDTSALTEYAAPGRALSGVIRTDWEQAWNLKTTLLHFDGGTVLLDHSLQTISVTDFSADSPLPQTFPCAMGCPPQESHYELMFRRSFFHPDPVSLAKKKDFEVHSLLWEPENRS